MKSTTTHKCRQGFSIIELIVSMAIMSIVMAGTYQLFTEGAQLFRVNQAAADAQVAVTKAAGAITAELANASPRLTRHYGLAYTGGGAGGAGIPGLVFTTPVDKDGKVHYDETNGRLYWQRYISYYFEADLTGGHNGKIYRGESNVAGDPGSPIPGSKDLGILEAFLLANTTSHFASGTGVQRRVISDGVSGFYVQPYDANPDFGTTAEKPAYDVIIEAGDKEQSFRNSYFIRVKIRVAPGAR